MKAAVDTTDAMAHRMTQERAPLVDASVDLKGFAGFILDVEALQSSELLALATPEEIAAALMLWCRAWQQVPHGSLPNDERVLASFSRAKDWPRVRDMALRGFVLCSDGRLYHRTLCKKVMEAWTQRQAYSRRREKDAERMRDWRGRKGERREAALPAREGACEAARDGARDGALDGDGAGDHWRGGGAGVGIGDEIAGGIGVDTGLRVGHGIDVGKRRPGSGLVTRDVTAAAPALSPLRREVKGSEVNHAVPGGTGAGALATLPAEFDASGEPDAACKADKVDHAGDVGNAADASDAADATKAIDAAKAIDPVHAGKLVEAHAGGITLLPADLPRQQLWQAGKALLAQSGMAARQCGSFIGKLVSQHGERIVAEAVRAAVTAQPAEPAEYLVAACRRAAGMRSGGGRAGMQEALEARNHAVADKLAQEAP